MGEFEIKIDEYKTLLQIMMSKKRYTHSVNVADMALRLAELNGFDGGKAYIAGLLHDIKKEETPEAMKSQAILSEMGITDIELSTPALWHAPASAYYVRKTLKIDDMDILNAIRFHTIGRADMSVLEKIVYLADLVSEERSYKDVEKYRKYALSNLDNAMYNALKWTIGETIGKSGMIPHYTFEAYNFYLKIDKEKRMNNKSSKKGNIIK